MNLNWKILQMPKCCFYFTYWCFGSKGKKCLFSIINTVGKQNKQEHKVQESWKKH